MTKINRNGSSGGANKWTRSAKKRKRSAEIQRSVALRRTLPAGVVDGVVLGEDDLGDGDEGVALLQQALNDAGQGRGGVLGGIMEQYDGTGTFYGQVRVLIYTDAGQYQLMRAEG